MSEFVEFLLHADRKLLELVAQYGSWVYGILFAIVFAETGFVVTPFLPGDSLLDRKSTRLNSSHIQKSRMPSSA